MAGGEPIPEEWRRLKPVAIGRGRFRFLSVPANPHPFHSSSHWIEAVCRGSANSGVGSQTVASSLSDSLSAIAAGGLAEE